MNDIFTTLFKTNLAPLKNGHLWIYKHINIIKIEVKGILNSLYKDVLSRL